MKNSRHSTIAIDHEDKELNKNLLALMPTYSAKRLFKEMQKSYAKEVCKLDPVRFKAVTGFVYCPKCGERAKTIKHCKGGTNNDIDEKEQMPDV